MIIGVIFLFFVPGFLLTEIFFHDSELLEKIILSILLSVAFFVMLGLLLGFSELNMKLTGGLSKNNVWVYTVVINAILFFILIYKSKKSKKKSSKRRKKK